MKYFDTFTGIGGFTLAITQVYEELCIKDKEQEKKKVRDSQGQSGKLDNVSLYGLACIGFSEIDKYATQIYQKHFPNHKAYGSITNIDTTTLPDFDLLTGGFPCQSFSIAGKRGGFEDTRGTLFFELARILEAKRPQNFIFENVKGLLSHDGGNTFKIIIRTLTELGYCVEWQVLNSKNFGVPQNRERVFIVGHLGGIPERKVFPIGEDNEKADELPGQCLNTLTTRYYGGQANGTYILESELDAQKDYRIRRLTPTECMRLQGFPDDWCDGISDTQKYKCAGNAVTVNVVREIVKRLYFKK